MSRQGPAGSETAQKRLRDREKVKTIQGAEDIKALMKQPAFRRFAWWLIDDVTRSRSSCFGPDDRTMAYFNGRRDAGLDLERALLKHADADYVVMVDEARRRTHNEKVIRDDAEAKAESDE